jgi:hypothetical protein
MDRVKVELGKVYHPLAFSSTMPRNLMPGHLTSGCDDRASANLERLQRSKDKVWGRLDAPRHVHGTFVEFATCSLLSSMR